MPKISCIMPVYNTAKYLDECIQSILNQSYEDFELIISDDGSTDGSKEIIKKYEYNDSRIVFINNKKNRGICPNLNDCIKLAKGEYIAIMESDDISILERFNDQLLFLEKNNDYCIVGSYCNVIDEDGKIKYTSKVDTEYSDILRNFLYKNAFITPGIMLRKNIFKDKDLKIEKGNIWDSNLFNTLLLKGGKVGNINKVLILKRELKSSLLHSNYIKIINKVLINNLSLIIKFGKIKPIYFVNIIKKYIYSLLSILIK